MHIGLYYHILEIGIMFEKGKKEGKLWKIGERKRLKKESSFWQSIIKHINLEISGMDFSDDIFDEMLMLAEVYDIKNYYRIFNMKNELKKYDDNIEYAEEDLKYVNEIFDELLFDFNLELTKLTGKKNAYRILEVMHNFPRAFHGRDVLGGGEIISFEDAVKYSTWCMTDTMKSKYNFCVNIQNPADHHLIFVKNREC